MIPASIGTSISFLTDCTMLVETNPVKGLPTRCLPDAPPKRRKPRPATGKNSITNRGIVRPENQPSDANPGPNCVLFVAMPQESRRIRRNALPGGARLEELE